MAKKLKSKKKAKKTVERGVVFVSSSYNNTIIGVSDIEGQIITTSSSGMVGFKGSKKSTAYAATKSAQDAVERAMAQYGLKEVKVIVRGAGLGRQAAVKGIKASGVRITSLSDKTPIAHNGCRPKKKPRGS